MKTSTLLLFASLFTCLAAIALRPHALTHAPSEGAESAQSPSIATVSSLEAMPSAIEPAAEQIKEGKDKSEGKQSSEEGQEFIAGTDHTRLRAYMSDFNQTATTELRQQLADLEQQVEVADYFRRANNGQLNFAETMAFDDLLKRQEAIHLILLSRKLERLAALTSAL